MAEDYVRPPLVAFEPPSPRAARWRFRVVVGLVFLVVLGGLAVLLFTVLLANNEGNPGLTPQGLGPGSVVSVDHPPAAAVTSTVATVPPPAAGVSRS